MKIQKSAEDYLETMLRLKKEKGYIRSIDIARHLEVSKPSVSYATKRLRENGYITMADDGHIELTDSGFAIAAKIDERHRTLFRFLTKIGVSEETAAEDACRIEHDLSDETFRAICRHLEEEV